MRVLAALTALVLSPALATAQTCVMRDNELATRIGFVINWAGENCRGVRRLSGRDFTAWFEEATGVSDAMAAPGQPCAAELLGLSMQVHSELAADPARWCATAQTFIRTSPWLKARMQR